MGESKKYEEIVLFHSRYHTAFKQNKSAGIQEWIDFIKRALQLLSNIKSLQENSTTKKSASLLCSILTDTRILKCLSKIYLKVFGADFLNIINDVETKAFILEELVINFLKIIKFIDRDSRSEFVEKNKALMCKLFRTLCTCGDYNCQLLILTIIFRLCTHTQIIEYVTEVFPQSLRNIANSFLKIKKHSFYTDVRTFLNTLNRTVENVFSIKCLQVYIGDIAIDAITRNALGEPEFWIDFNKHSNKVTFTCNPDPSCSDIFYNAINVYYRKVSIEEENVRSVVYSKIQLEDLPKSMHTVVLFNLVGPLLLENVPAETVNKFKQSNIKFVFLNSEDLQKLITKILPGMFRKKFKKAHVPKPLTMIESSPKVAVSGLRQGGHSLMGLTTSALATKMPTVNNIHLGVSQISFDNLNSYDDNRKLNATSDDTSNIGRLSNNFNNNKNENNFRWRNKILVTDSKENNQKDLIDSVESATIKGCIPINKPNTPHQNLSFLSITDKKKMRDFKKRFMVTSLPPSQYHNEEHSFEEGMEKFRSSHKNLFLSKRNRQNDSDISQTEIDDHTSNEGIDLVEKPSPQSQNFHSSHNSNQGKNDVQIISSGQSEQEDLINSEDDHITSMKTDIIENFNDSQQDEINWKDKVLVSDSAKIDQPIDSDFDIFSQETQTVDIQEKSPTPTNELNVKRSLDNPKAILVNNKFPIVHLEQIKLPIQPKIKQPMDIVEIKTNKVKVIQDIQLNQPNFLFDNKKLNGKSQIGMSPILSQSMVSKKIKRNATPFNKKLKLKTSTLPNSTTTNQISNCMTVEKQKEAATCEDAPKKQQGSNQNLLNQNNTIETSIIKENVEDKKDKTTFALKKERVTKTSLKILNTTERLSYVKNKYESSKTTDFNGLPPQKRKLYNPNDTSYINTFDYSKLESCKLQEKKKENSEAGHITKRPKIEKPKQKNYEQLPGTSKAKKSQTVQPQKRRDIKKSVSNKMILKVIKADKVSKINPITEETNEGVDKEKMIKRHKSLFLNHLQGLIKCCVDVQVLAKIPDNGDREFMNRLYEDISHYRKNNL